MATYTTRRTCRVCGGSELTPLFSLGEQFVSDFVPGDKVRSGHRCPIDVDLCSLCTLVQARHTAPQDFLYTKKYWYRSGTTDTMRAALRDVANRAVERVGGLARGDAVLDVGANDGTLLSNYGAGFVYRVGVEPADNLVDECRRHCDLTVHDFWSYGALQGYFDNLGGEKFKIVTALGMFYDLEDPNQFVRDVAQVLRPDGLFVAQLMCLRQTVDKHDVGNFAHEHLEFYSLHSLRYLFSKHGLKIVDVEENSVNGGSYRLYVRPADHEEVPSSRVDQLLRLERRLQLPDTYAGFRSRIESNGRAVRDAVASAVERGKKVWVYGASTKGNMMLQYWGIDSSVITAAADRDRNKWGLYTVGTGIPIVSEAEFRRAQSDYALVLPYAFMDEIYLREAEWRSKGGKFIVPLPELHTV